MFVQIIDAIGGAPDHMENAMCCISSGITDAVSDIIDTLGGIIDLSSCYATALVNTLHSMLLDLFNLPSFHWDGVTLNFELPTSVEWNWFPNIVFDPGSISTCTLLSLDVEMDPPNWKS
jgi:hypothetical protein